VYHKYKQTLIYREGFTSESGRMNQGFRTEPEIFIFDPEPDKSLYTYPDASLQIANAIKFAISLHPNLKLISGSEEAQIRNAIKKKKGVEAYTESVYYSPDSIDILDIDRKEGSRIRYIAYGTFTEDKNNLTVRYKIYDRVSGKIIDTINTTASNRNSIAEISVRVAKRISNSIPLDGRIIKINQDGVIVNLGTKDGIDKDFILEAVIPGQDNIKMKVITVDEYVSKAIPEEKGWGKNLSLRDRIIVVGKKNNEKDSEKK